MFVKLNLYDKMGYILIHVVFHVLIHIMCHYLFHSLKHYCTTFLKPLFAKNVTKNKHSSTMLNSKGQVRLNLQTHPFKVIVSSDVRLKTFLKSSSKIFIFYFFNQSFTLYTRVFNIIVRIKELKYYLRVLIPLKF